MTTRKLTVALVGNPNTGKSTLFNALTGLRQHVGNYPGVTVEMKVGTARLDDVEIELIDLPGTYSLAPRSPDEMVSVDLLLGHVPGSSRPDVIVSIVDASNLERHLYLTTQLMDLGVPIVVAANLVDVARKQGLTIDFATLTQRLGVPVVPIQANHGIGLDELKKAIVQTAEASRPPEVPFPEVFRSEVSSLEAALAGKVERFLAGRLLLDVGGHSERLLVAQFGPTLANRLVEARSRLATAGSAVPAVEARTRYGWIRQTVAGCVRRPATRVVTTSDRLDRVFTHKLWGTLIFLALMFGLFEAVFVGAKPLMDSIDAGRSWLEDQVHDAMKPGPLRSLLTDGVLKGVGGVLVFLPQILILFARRSRSSKTAATWPEPRS